MIPVFLLASIFNLIPPLLHAFNKYKDAVIKSHRIKYQHQFLKSCLSDIVTPKSLLPERLRHYYNIPFSNVEGAVLKRSFENAVREKNVAFSRSREALRRMNNLCECYNVY